MRAGLANYVEPRRGIEAADEKCAGFAGCSVEAGVKLGLNPEGAGGLTLVPGFSFSCLLR